MFLSLHKIAPPKQFLHNPQLQDKFGWTVSLILEKNEIQIPNEWLYDPLYSLNDKYTTTAMILAQQGIIPSAIWQHEPELQDSYGNTVAVYLELKGIKTPKQWQYDQLYKIGKFHETTAMKIANYGIIPSEYWNHDPLLTNVFSRTIALTLAKKGIIPPQQWYHDKYIQDNEQKIVYDYLDQKFDEIPQCWNIKQFNKQIENMLDLYCNKYNIERIIIIQNPAWQYNEDKETFAMMLVKNNIMPIQQFIHDRLIKDKYGNTIAILLSKNGIIPNKKWIHDVNLQNLQKQSIKTNLRKYGYYYIDNQFIKVDPQLLNVVKMHTNLQVLDDICQICLEEGQQVFVKTHCTHKFCIQCFYEMVQIQNFNSCPVCRRLTWYEKSNNIKQYE